MFLNSSGIIFLGTPHNGSSISGLAAIIASCTGLLGSNAGLLLALPSNEAHFGDLSKRFNHILDAKDANGQGMKILSICEKKSAYILNCLSISLVHILVYISIIIYQLKPSVPWSPAAFVTGKTVEVLEITPVLTSARIQRIYCTQSWHSNCANYDCEWHSITWCPLAAADSKKNYGTQWHPGGHSWPPSTDDRFFGHFDPEITEEDEDKPECYPGTRSEILHEVHQWLDKDTPSEKHIYWLQGRAGTGKSAIARKLAEQKHLGATFFFKRAEQGGNNSQKFFTTTIHQLVAKLPAIANSINNSIRSTWALFESYLVNQFGKLFSEPLKSLLHK